MSTFFTSPYHNNQAQQLVDSDVFSLPMAINDIPTWDGIKNVSMVAIIGHTLEDFYARLIGTDTPHAVEFSRVARRVSAVISKHNNNRHDSFILPEAINDGIGHLGFGVSSAEFFEGLADFKKQHDQVYCALSVQLF